MNLKLLLRRVILAPIGIIKGGLEFANSKARDLENKLRFPKAIIDIRCTFSKSTSIGVYSHIYEGAIINNSHIGSYTYINKNSLLQNALIGNYCSISQDVIIGLGAHPLNMFSTSTVFYKFKNALNISIVKKDAEFKEYQQVNVGSDVWVGARVIIKDGVNIGHGAVLGAGSVVTKDVPPFAIVAGVPAKVIKYRFEEKVCLNLLKTEWWNMKAEEVYLYKDELIKICKGEDFKNVNNV